MSIFNRIFKRGDTAEGETALCEYQTVEVDKPKQTTPKEAFSTKYPAYDNSRRMFEAANLYDVTWENLTKVRLQKFIDYMNERLSPNSVNQYEAKLKAVLNLYSDDVLLPRGFAKVLTP